MNQLTKAQLTIGILAYFATVWKLVEQALNATDVYFALGIAALQFVALILISIIVLGILEWIKIFDLKTNSILTFIVLIAIGLSAAI